MTTRTPNDTAQGSVVGSFLDSRWRVVGLFANVPKGQYNETFNDVAPHMTSQFCKTTAVAFLASFSWSSASHGAGLHCADPVNDIEAAICARTELSQLAALANALGGVVGLDVRYDANSVYEDFGLGRGVGRLLSTLTFAEAHNLTGLSRNVPWDFDFDVPNRVLIVRSEDVSLQEGLVVFDPESTSTSTPIFTAFGTTYDAVRYSYRMVDTILERTASARPSDSTEKFRYQDGCWRLIGTDANWASYMVEFNDDLAAISINHLTGRSIFDFKDKKGVVRTFTPIVHCLGDGAFHFQIAYDDPSGQ